MSDVVAIGAMSALREAGRGVGEDVALCGFDDIPTSRDVTPALSTVRIPLEEVGHQALRMIVEDRDADPTGVTLDVVAIGAMSALREAGRGVGEDVALCGFDDIPMSPRRCPLCESRSRRSATRRCE